MNDWFILSSGLLAALTAVVHLIAGGKDVAAPLLQSSLDEVVKLTLYACWHLVSVCLVLSSLALLSNGIGLVNSPPMVAFISALWILFGVVFLVITVGVAKPQGLFRLPQWILLVPVGLLGLYGIA